MDFVVFVLGTSLHEKASHFGRVVEWYQILVFETPHPNECGPLTKPFMFVSNQIIHVKPLFTLLVVYYLWY